MPELISDQVQPFLFDALDIRGALVSLDQSWRDLCRTRTYPAPVRNMLGEMACVTALVGANLKQRGRLTFQVQGSGPVSLLVVDCDEQLRLRGMARCPNPVADLPVPDLLGHGQLALTLDSHTMRQPYQSLVPLQGETVAAIFEHYLETSEQQPTRLLLAANAERAVGLFLQTLPGAAERDPDGWNRVKLLTATLKIKELLSEAGVPLLQRLFPEEDLRIYPPRPVSHHCPRDEEKVHAMLRSLGRTECDATISEQGELLIHDELCGHTYRFDAVDIEAIFAAPAHRFH